LTRLARSIYAALRAFAERIVEGEQAIAEAWREAKALEAAEREARERALAPRILPPSSAGTLDAEGATLTGLRDTLSGRAPEAALDEEHDDERFDDEAEADEEDEAPEAYDEEEDLDDVEADEEDEGDIGAPDTTSVVLAAKT